MSTSRLRLLHYLEQKFLEPSLFCFDEFSSLLASSQDSANPSPQTRLTLLARKCALRSRAYGLGFGPLSRMLLRPASCLTVQMMAPLFLFCGTSQQPLNLPLPTISSVLQTVLVCCMCFCLCARVLATISVISLFVFTCAVCPCVFSVLIIHLYSFVLFLHSSFW
jgi:hypothetical protein